ATQARKNEQGDQQSEEQKLEPPEQSYERDKSVWLVVASIAIGPLAWICLRVLNESDPTQLKVYEYDLWWPPLVWWMSMCIVGSSFAACPVRLRRYWLVSCLAVSALLGFIAPERWHLHPPSANPGTLPLWILCLSLSFPALLGNIAWSIRIPWFGKTAFEARPWRWAFTILMILAGLVTCLFWASGGQPLWPGYVFWVVVGAVVALLLGRKAVAGFDSWRSAGYPIHDYGKPGRWDDILLLLGLLAIIGGTSDLLWFSFFYPVLDLIVLILAWLVIVEVVTVDSPVGRPVDSKYRNQSLLA